MVCVYCLASKKNPKFHYYGYTSDINARLKRHQRGAVKTTRRFLPVYLLGYKEFDNIAEDKTFERLIKKNFQVRNQFLNELKK
ncbi:GIY-YIG nuclease family protein [Candidatus Dojkabacteria bacterium]|uniref:GIY-YIG nuclease family protein n=1 Tax=Candidatus Dojkabacteria bacterium TaxID=2099670 RepID=A0A955LB53_9BACT|nr:GIY-YIG nuclease family protein [Candidatus Dojkabacteria bacterium]